MGISEMNKSSDVIIRTIVLMSFSIWRKSLPLGKAANESHALARKGKWQRSDLGLILGSSTATEAGEIAKRKIPWLSAKSRRISILNFPPATLDPNLGLTW